MKTIYLVACVSTKLEYPAAAGEIYKSALFLKSKELAEAEGNQWFVLSALHGLLTPGEIISPYNKTLKTASAHEKFEWSKSVYAKLRQLVTTGDHVVFLAGIAYRSHLERFLKADGIAVSAPLAGLSIGQQLQRLNVLIDNSLEIDRRSIYAVLADLKAKGFYINSLRNLTGTKLPLKGVYFFLDPEESCKYGAGRIVRVGTHAVSNGSKATLYQRLSAHRGMLDGRGNHRASIFRLHVGKALINRNNLFNSFPSWGIGQSADKVTVQAEVALELEVSKYLKKLEIIYLPILDPSGKDSDRAFIERNSIRVISELSGHEISASPQWLGLFSAEERIKRSGLWNLNHLEGPKEAFFKQILRRLCALSEAPSNKSLNSLIKQINPSWIQGELDFKKFPRE